MKKVFAHSALFSFINVLSIMLASFSIVLTLIFQDSEVWKMIFVSLFFTGLSFMLLINRIEYDEKVIHIKFAIKKKTIRYIDIKEIYYFNNKTKGCEVVFNLECAIDYICSSSLIYMKKCKDMGITNMFNFAGIRFKDMQKLLKYYQGKIISNNEEKTV